MWIYPRFVRTLLISIETVLGLFLAAWRFGENFLKNDIFHLFNTIDKKLL